jgi:trk system potassium uptake protein TrkA
MSRINDIKNSLIAGYCGFQEAILEVAEKVNIKTQETKILLEIKDFENKMNSVHARLGEIGYQLKEQGISTVYENPEIYKILNVCKLHHEKILRLREKYHSIAKSNLDGQVRFLNQVLENRNIKLIRLTIGKKSSLRGCRVKDLKLSPDILILCVIKKKRVVIANGDTRIDDQDSIFVIGPEAQIEQLKEEAWPNPQ